MAKTAILFSTMYQIKSILKSILIYKLIFKTICWLCDKQNMKFVTVGYEMYETHISFIYKPICLDLMKADILIFLLVFITPNLNFANYDSFCYGGRLESSLKQNGLHFTPEAERKDELQGKNITEHVYESLNSKMKNDTVIPRSKHHKDCGLNMSFGNMFCARCGEGFESHEKIVNSSGEVWHQSCFVCVQCFRPFPDGIFYEFEGRKYCEHDFHVLFAPCCGLCNEFIVGRVIKAMNNNWHPNCFRCDMCQETLADQGFIKNADRALCHDCNAKVKAAAAGKYICTKCRSIIDDGPLKFKGEAFHPYHFNCKMCGVELTLEAREVKEELYCLRCHDRMGIPICGACHRPIDGERVVTALGKHWHVEHFVCARCEKPFLGHRHYEKKGLAYCETHYHQLFGNLCFVCNQVIAGDVFTALNKAWHVDHFACYFCDSLMSQKSKFFDVDGKPSCKKCYEKLPTELRKRLKKAFEQNTPKKAVTS
ncbi:LIM domain-containing protein unc-97 [Nymphon striatum]|nr:LIM domain-containing protein unc-97 [Nymphon striatum]